MPVTNSSTLRLKEKREERGSCQTLGAKESRMKVNAFFQSKEYK